MKNRQDYDAGWRQGGRGGRGGGWGSGRGRAGGGSGGSSWHGGGGGRQHGRPHHTPVQGGVQKQHNKKKQPAPWVPTSAVGQALHALLNGGGAAPPAVLAAHEPVLVPRGGGGRFELQGGPAPLSVLVVSSAAQVAGALAELRRSMSSSRCVVRGCLVCSVSQSRSAAPNSAAPACCPARMLACRLPPPSLPHPNTESFSSKPPACLPVFPLSSRP